MGGAGEEIMGCDSTNVTGVTCAEGDTGNALRAKGETGGTTRGARAGVGVEKRMYSGEEEPGFAVRRLICGTSGATWRGEVMGVGAEEGTCLGVGLE